MNHALTVPLSVMVVSLILARAASAYDVTGIGAGSWGAPDAVLGIEGLQIEDFEDTTLLPDLSVEIDTNGAKNPLDNSFEPTTQDPFGDAFEDGVWDGTRVAINTADNLPGPYLDDPTWQVITFHIDGGAQRVGFSLENVDTDVQLAVNGVAQGGVLTLSGLPVGPGRQGYVVVSMEEGDAPITSLAIDNNLSGASLDGYAFDHLAIEPLAQNVPMLSPTGTLVPLGILLAMGVGRIITTNERRRPPQ